MYPPVSRGPRTPNFFSTCNFSIERSSCLWFQTFGTPCIILLGGKKLQNQAISNTSNIRSYIHTYLYTATIFTHYTRKTTLQVTYSSVLSSATTGFLKSDTVVSGTLITETQWTNATSTNTHRTITVQWHLLEISCEVQWTISHCRGLLSPIQ